MGGGGGETNQHINQTFNMSAVNKSIFNSITTNQAITEVGSTNIQDMQVNIGKVIGCDIKLGQKIESETIASSDFTAETVNDIKNEITNDMKASAQAALEKSTQMGSELGALVSGDTNMTLEQAVDIEVENIIETTITTTNLNKTAAESVNIQGGQVNIQFYDCTDGGQLDFQQDIVSRAVAESITKMLTRNIADSSLLNKISADAAGTTTSKAGGLAEMFDSIFGGLAGPAKYGIIASVLCVCVVAIVALLAFLSPAGQNMGRKAMNKV